MKTAARAFVLAAAGLLAVAACGNGDDSGDVATGELQGQTVEVAAVWTGEEQANFQRVLDAFAQQTGATISYTSTGDDIATVLGTRIQGGSPPDVAMLPQPGLLRRLADQGSLTAAPQAVTDRVDSNYAPIWKDLGSVNGTLYGVWFKAANKSTIWYNNQTFEQAGVQPPANWDEFVSRSQTIANSGVAPLSIGGADGWVLTDWFENVYLRTAGPDKYDQLSRHEIPWTDDSVKTALRQMGELWAMPGFVAPGALQTSFPASVSQTFASPPKAAMVFEGDFVAGVISSSTSAVVGTDAKFFPFPEIGSSGAAVVGGGDVAVALKDTPGATALLEFLATPAAAEAWASQGGFISPNKELDVSVYPDDTTREIAQALIDAGDNFRFDMSDLAPSAFGGTPGAGEWKILQDFLADPTSVDATAAQLEAAAAQAFP